MYPGLTLQKRLKGKNTLTVLFCVFSFQWVVSSICVVLSVRQQGSIGAGTFHIDLPGSVKHLVCSVFVFFCLGECVCVCWGMVTGDSDS